MGNTLHRWFIDVMVSCKQYLNKKDQRERETERERVSPHPEEDEEDTQKESGYFQSFNSTCIAVVSVTSAFVVPYWPCILSIPEPVDVHGEQIIWMYTTTKPEYYCRTMSLRSRGGYNHAWFQYLRKAIDTRKARTHTHVHTPQRHSPR